MAGNSLLFCACSINSDLVMALHSDDTFPILSENIPISFVIAIAYSVIISVLL